MQINRNIILNKFKNYLDTLSTSNKNSLVVSYATKIDKFDFVKLTNSNIINAKEIFYWNIKAESLEFLAVDPLISFNEFGEDRMKDTCNKINKFEEEFISNWTELNLVDIPLVVGGIKFAPNQKSEIWEDYSDSDWFIPKMLLFRKNEELYFVYNFYNNIDQNVIIDDFLTSLSYLSSSTDSDLKQNIKISDPIITNSFDSWERIVNNALENISEGLLSKVVLSREIKLQLSEQPIISELLTDLSDRYPNCYVYLFRRGNSNFIGASPEKLAKISNNWIEVDALAGSAPRGKNDIEDIEMEEFLLNSEKNLFEQRAVVNFIHNLLIKFSDEIIFDDKPVIRKLPNIQHLWTIMKARLKDDIKMFDLLMRLHPTPAICGDPWKIAKDLILEMEPHDRGLYSGNIGWFNYNGCGEFAVGIRSAIINESNLFAYAGCGIVEGSEPNSEYEESEIKLKPILSLFVDEKIYQP